MASSDFALSVSDDGDIARLRAALAEMPKALERARRRALRLLMTWVRRQALRAASQATGAAQKTLTALLRYRASQDAEGGIEIWIGTNDLAAQHLGTVRWSRRMKGARAGRRLFPGTWSWGPGSGTGTAIMHRTGEVRRMTKGRYAGKRREAIDVTMVPIHEAVERRIDQIMPEVEDRYQRLMLQQLNYELNVVAARAQR